MEQTLVYIILSVTISLIFTNWMFGFVDGFARGKWLNVAAGVFTIALLATMIFPFLFKIKPTMAVALIPIGYTVHRSLRLIAKGIKIKRPNVLVLGWNEKTITLLVKGIKEFQGVDEGFFYVYGNSLKGKPFVVSNYEFRRVPEYRVKWTNDGLLLSIDCPRRFVSGFIKGWRGFVVARCIRIKVGGNRIYVCPPIESVRMFVDRSLRIETPEGIATLSMGVYDDRIVMLLNARLKEGKVGVSIVRKNLLTKEETVEKVFETGKSGMYRIIWKPSTTRRPIVFTEEDHPHRVFEGVSDLTSELNLMKVVLSIERKGRVSFKWCNLIVEPGQGRRFWRFAIQD